MLSARMLRWLKAQAWSLLETETREFTLLARRRREPRRHRRSGFALGQRLEQRRTFATAGDWSWRRISFAARRSRMRSRTSSTSITGRTFTLWSAALLGEDPRRAQLWLRREGAALHSIGRPFARAGNSSREL